MTITAAVLLLTGCAKEPEAGIITVDASIGALTKVASNGAASSFETGDKIAVYAWTGSATEVPAGRVLDGVVNTLGSDGKWAPASPMYWKPGLDAHYFLGVSPARTVSDFTADAFTLSGVYATDDLLIARNLAGVKPGSGAVALSFQHAMARLTVNVRLRNEFGVSPAVSASVSAKGGAMVNYLTQAVTATGDASDIGLAAETSAASGYTHSFSGIQVPQDGVKSIVVTVGGNRYIYTAGEDIPLTSGHHTTLGLLVGKDKIELSGVSISDLKDGGSIPGGTAAVTKINGHEFVDMGNGLLWATCNVGASNPEESGDYFAWGETATMDNFRFETYQWMEAGKNEWKYITKYSFADGQTSGIWYDGGIFKGDNGDGVEHKDLASYNYVDDAARANWGGDWRTPTDAEWTWLRDHCTWVWQDDYNSTGVKGMLVTSMINGNQIFLPAAGLRNLTNFGEVGSHGYYWSSSLRLTDVAYELLFDSEDGVRIGQDSRSYGQPVRPVLGTPLPALGDLYYSDGTYSSTLVAGKTPIGVIAYVDQLGTADDEITEKSHGGGHGLVLCLKNAASNVCWSTETSTLEFGDDAKVDNLDALKRTTDVSGYTNTATLAAKAGAATKYPAAWQAKNYTGLTAPAGTTGWFLPSAQQWVKMQEGLGGLAEGDIKWRTWFDNDHTAADKWETAMAKAGTKGTAYDSVTDDYLWYWSSSEGFADDAVYLGVDATGTGKGYGFYWNLDYKFYLSTYFRVRPVLAF
jgi:hypothetical protein